MKKRHSLKRVILVPYLSVMVLIMATVGFVYNYDYRWLVDVQGDKIMGALSENTLDRLNYFLKGPIQMADLYEEYIVTQELYGDEDLQRLENFSMGFIKQISAENPQISTIGYGSENGDYLGVRVNTKDNYNLMLIDSRTDKVLNIYEGETTASKVVAAYEGYDPRVRPWYEPVKENQKDQWSEIYINFDEKKESTISILKPVFDKNKNFVGVVVVDVKLDGINGFLSSENNRFGGAVYIVDSEGRLIGHSENYPVVIPSKENPTEGVLMKAIDSTNPLISESGKLLAVGKLVPEKMFQLEGHDRSYGWFSKLEGVNGLEWSVVVALPENALMGDVLSHQLLTLIVLLIVMLLTMVGGVYMLGRITQPVVRISEAIGGLSESEFNKGMDEEFNYHIENETFQLRETAELTQAFNKLTQRLMISFNALKDSEEKYRGLVENADDMIYSLDENKCFVAVNDAFEKVTKLNRREIIGQHVSNLASLNPSLEHWARDLEQIIDEPDTMKSTTHMLDDSGRRQTYKMTTSPIIDDKGKRILTTATCHNITDIIEIEAEKIASLSYVVSGISHEINTPVGNCITIASYMMNEITPVRGRISEGTIKKTDLQRFIDTIEESSSQIVANLERTRSLVDAFKELAATSSGGQKVDVQLEPFLIGLFNAFSHTHPDKSLDFKLECSNDIFIHCDQLQLMQVFTELFENSYYHGFEGKESGTISVTVEDVGGDTVDIVYIDDGVGIDADISKDLFTPFFSTKFSTDHSGLGMNVIYNTIKTNFGGNVFINDRRKAGFELRISMSKSSESGGK